MSFGLTLLVYPVNGVNGCEYSLSFAFAAAGTELENNPSITGCCALSPSRKNPRTVSPGEIFGGFPLPALPEPASGDFNTCAQGNSSFFSSISFSG